MRKHWLAPFALVLLLGCGRTSPFPGGGPDGGGTADGGGSSVGGAGGSPGRDAAVAGDDGGSPGRDAAVAGDDGGSPGGDAALPSQCRVTSDRTPPFTVTFRLRNAGAAPVFLPVGCIGLEPQIASCASGFTDRLGPIYTCACSCADATCRSNPACGPCPMPSGRRVAPGETVELPWQAAHVALEARTGYACRRETPLPAARYRASFLAFRTEAAARLRTLSEGWSAVQDFALPAAGDRVEIDLAPPAATAACRPFDTSPAAACAAPYAREGAPCDLDAGYAYAFEGGLAPWYDRTELTPPAAYTLLRSYNPQVQARPSVSCKPPVPRCWAGVDDVVTTADVARALAAPDVVQAFAQPTMLVHGYDERANDGAALVLRRADGRGFIVGAPCGEGRPCARPLTAGLAALRSLLQRLDRQQLAEPACQALRP